MYEDGPCKDIASSKVAVPSSISDLEDEESLSLSSRGLTTFDLHRFMNLDASNLQSEQQQQQQQQQHLLGPLSSSLFMPPFQSMSIVRLDLSRNKLTSLPRELFGGIGEHENRSTLPCPFPSLEFLDVGRNQLKELPPDIANCKRLRNIVALSNNLRWAGFPAAALSSLPLLRVLDLRWNPKLNSQSSRQRLLELFPQTQGHGCGEREHEQPQQREQQLDGDRVRLVLPPPKYDPSCDENHLDEDRKPKKLSACDRDANELRSQLEPLSTPQLRKRLFRTFGVEFGDDDEHAYDREVIMRRLLRCYHQSSSGGTDHHGDSSVPLRSVRYERGVAIDPRLENELLEEMKAICWPRTTRERPKISAEGYVILQRPPPSAVLTPCATTSTSAAVDDEEKHDPTRSSRKAHNKAKREVEKLKRFIGIWTKAVEAIESVDKVFAQQFTALAVTKNFRGSPHIDTLNIAPFYGLSLGDFTPRDKGGKLCVECSATEVAEIDTRGRLAKVDGRFCHWVSDYEGTRYSLIYYVTHGDTIPQTTAIFEPHYVTATEKDGKHE